MKLLVVSTFFESHRGGLEIVAGTLARELKTRGLQVRWLASSASPAPSDIDAVPVRAWNVAEDRLGVPYPVFGLRALARVFREVRAADAVLIHDALYMSSIAALLAAKLLRRPVVVVQHIGEVPYWNPLLHGLMRLANRLVARPMLRFADRTVFISAPTHRHFAGIRFSAAPLLIMNGVDHDTFRPALTPAAQAEIRARLRLSPDRRLALFVGRFVEKKGLNLLREAARGRPDLDWVLAGWGPIDPASWALPNVSVRSDLKGTSLAELYAAADVFVIPSRGEGFPLVVQEALACGLPVVCGAETASADEAASPFLLGVETDGADALEALNTAVDRALEQTWTQRRQRADFAAKRYSWTAAADRYLELIGQLAARSRRRTAPPLQAGAASSI